MMESIKDIKNTAALAYWRDLGVTIAAIYHGGEIYIGCSLKSPKDTYAKTIGKKYAIHRAASLGDPRISWHQYATKLNFNWNDPPLHWILPIRNSIIADLRRGAPREYHHPIDAWRPDRDDGIRVMNLVRQAILRSTGLKPTVPSLEDLRPTLEKRIKEIQDELNEKLEAIEKG